MSSYPLRRVILLFIGVTAAAPVFASTGPIDACLTFVGASCANGGSIFLPQETITWSAANPTVTPNLTSPNNSITFFQRTLTGNGNTNTPGVTTFSLDMFGPGMPSVSFTATEGPSETLTFAGTGSYQVNGVDYATIQEGSFLFGVQQNASLKFDGYTPISGFVTRSSLAVPEPAALLLAGVGLVAFAVALRRRRPSA